MFTLGQVIFPPGSDSIPTLSVINVLIFSLQESDFIQIYQNM